MQGSMECDLSPSPLPSGYMHVGVLARGAVFVNRVVDDGRGKPNVSGVWVGNKAVALPDIYLSTIAIPEPHPMHIVRHIETWKNIEWFLKVHMRQAPQPVELWHIEAEDAFQRYTKQQHIKEPTRKDNYLLQYFQHIPIVSKNASAASPEQYLH
ncbi:hypothetical protein K431DRAFT_298813 [Polychaeton citri CBS 116435]|uniref:Uncharacterized protein n=1 Tax=Polychaeton citri CBS 116435 TaxID=1314669 RepID=A0A9P4Q1B3_9PEZI|nr:hypothetical protein K431DRAFT_298813 [Polychaeton citri CBS 116435]